MSENIPPTRPSSKLDTVHSKLPRSTMGQQGQPLAEAATLDSGEAAGGLPALAAAAAAVSVEDLEALVQQREAELSGFCHV